MLNSGFSPWPSFSKEEADLVHDILLSNKVNYWTGEECRHFEKEFAEFTQCKYAVSLANGTLALELALLAIGIESGDEVIVPPRTFIASASSVVNIGGVPVFADVDYDSQCISADAIADKITDKTKAIICVHLAGWPCDMDAIMALARKHDLKVIEDCAQAHGATIDGRPVGSWGDIGAWSFCQDKIMTTGGEGGMVTTNDETLWSFMWSYKDHGKSWDAIYNQQHAPGFRWLHHSFGSNFRMLEMQAVIGRYQLSQMSDWTRNRQENGEKIMASAAEFACFYVPDIPRNIQHAFYKLYVFVDEDGLQEGWDRDRIMNSITALGVPCFSGSCSEVYLERAFTESDYAVAERLPVAKKLGETSLAFLIHPTLTADEIAKTIDAIQQIGQQASRK